MLNRCSLGTDDSQFIIEYQGTWFEDCRLRIMYWGLRIGDGGVWIKDECFGSRIEDRVLMMEDWRPKIEGFSSRIEDFVLRIEDRRMRNKDWGLRTTKNSWNFIPHFNRSESTVTHRMKSVQRKVPFFWSCFKVLTIGFFAFLFKNGVGVEWLSDPHFQNWIEDKTLK